MNCNVARDLLASYNENLLEENTKSELEKHLSECEECRKLNEKLKTDLSEQENSVDADKDEIKPFKKVKKKLTTRIIIIVVLSIFVLFLGYLTIGQFAKIKNFYSFEMIAQDIKCRQITNCLKDGKIDKFLSYIDVGTGIDSINFEQYEDVKSVLKERITNAYNDEIKGKSFKINSVQTEYGHYNSQYFSSESSTINTITTVEAEIDGKDVSIFYEKIPGGFYQVDIMGYEDEGKYDLQEMGQIFDNINSMKYLDDDYNVSQEDTFIPNLVKINSKCGGELKIINHWKKEYEKFKKDNSYINAFHNGIRLDENTGKFYIDLSVTIYDGETDKKANYETKYYIFNPDGNGVDINSEQIINTGVREEKITEMKNLLTFNETMKDAEKTGTI